MKMNIAVLAGDGIGPEVIEQALKVVKAIAKKYNHDMSFEHGITGASAIDAVGNPYPECWQVYKMLRLSLVQELLLKMLHGIFNPVNALD